MFRSIEMWICDAGDAGGGEKSGCSELASSPPARTRMRSWRRVELGPLEERCHHAHRAAPALVGLVDRDQHVELRRPRHCSSSSR